MLIAEAPSLEEALVILDADATFTLPQHPLMPMEVLSLWEEVKPLLDAPEVGRIDVWAVPGYMQHPTTVAFLLHLGEVGRREGMVVRVRT